jgi:DNA (cytosine-5)-methyltransferase 1
MFTVVDLFSGCGGISRGFQRTGSFATEYAVEIEPHFARTFAANIRNSRGQPTRVFCGDIAALLADDSLRKEEFDRAGICKGNVDVIVGGPPCQGFSRNGVRQYLSERQTVRFYDDPRNHLYKCFLSFVSLLAPKVLFIENVREFLNFGGGKFSSDLLERLDTLGYRAAFRKICAADFGVPQVRHRVIFLAVRKDLKHFPGPDQLFPPSSHFAESSDMFGSGYVTVRDAIGDLPLPSTSRETLLPYPENNHVSSFAQTIRSKSGFVRNHFSRELSRKQVERIQAVGTGRMKHISASLQTKAFYGSAYGRLAWDEPSLTITTWVYHVGSGRFAHPTENRGLTMREAARLQSFDDDFSFPLLVNPVSRMIGNAVPPLLAEKIAASIEQVLTEKNHPSHRTMAATVPL